ncbi:hypothetical protein AB0J55_00590 [Amycolatopsis sp. NPDC049688]|uniref:hypothetical protein n=1 Tax=Amycolatopsis sp. NPDC049688 TaxID=3154733 RepID=UPI003427F44A
MPRDDGDLLIFVHGTFADSEDDEGPRWWQRGSDTWTWFADHLPDGVRLPDESTMHLKWFKWYESAKFDGEDEKPQPTLFHWNGSNTQVARLEAGNRLLALLIELERQGRGYHLVGHSHGGSIIWEALISAEVTRRFKTADPDLRRSLNTMRLTKTPLIRLRDDEFAPWWVKHKSRYIPRNSEFRAVEPHIELPGLRTWTTVGTPFLHYLPRRRFLVKGWPHPRFTLNPSANEVARSALGHGILQLLVAAPFFFLAYLLFFGRHGDVLPADWLAIVAAVVWVAAFVTLGNRVYAGALFARARSAPYAMKRFHDRWLGLWAPEDEAIAGLQGLAPDVGGYGYEWLWTTPSKRDDRKRPREPEYKVARRFQPLPMPLTDAYLIPHVQLLAPARIAKYVILAVNKLAGPMIGRKIVKMLVSNAHGANLPHRAPLVYVSRWPLPLELDCPGLPPDVVAEIQDDSAKDAGRLGELARQYFMLAALDGLEEAKKAYQETYDGNPLVHASYFEREAVRRLIRLHITKTCGDETDRRLADWLAANAAAVRTRVDKFVAGRL